MANYVYKESRVTTKKLAGIYDADTHTISVDNSDKDILEEFKDFNGSPVEIVLKVKEEIDLLDE